MTRLASRRPVWTESVLMPPSGVNRPSTLVDVARDRHNELVEVAQPSEVCDDSVIVGVRVLVGEKVAEPDGGGHSLAHGSGQHAGRPRSRIASAFVSARPSPSDAGGGLPRHPRRRVVVEQQHAVLGDAPG